MSITAMSITALSNAPSGTTPSGATPSGTSLPTIVIRPAVDARPPADAWLSSRQRPVDVSPNQPTLRLVHADADAGEELLTSQPAPTRVPLTVDTSPAGADPRLSVELEKQARTWAPWFAQLLTETLDGRRSLEPLGRWLDDWVLAEVSRRVRVQARARSHGTAAQPPPAGVVSLRAQLTHPRVLEVSAHLRRGRQSTALAFQLVRLGERWRCCALSAG